MHATMTEQQPLADVRIRAGFDTQEELAQAANLSKSMVWIAENPEFKRPISRKTAIKILAALERKGVKLGIEDLTWNVGKRETSEE